MRSEPKRVLASGRSTASQAAIGVGLWLAIWVQLLLPVGISLLSVGIDLRLLSVGIDLRLCP